MRLTIKPYPGNNPIMMIQKILSNFDPSITLPPKKHHIVKHIKEKPRIALSIFIALIASLPRIWRKRIPLTLTVYLYETIEVLEERDQYTVKIKDLYFYSEEHNIDHGLFELAQNEGFNSTEEFLKYFANSGKKTILHWTSLNYEKMIFDGLP